jgi:hypothetical protein
MRQRKRKLVAVTEHQPAVEAGIEAPRVRRKQVLPLDEVTHTRTHAQVLAIVAPKPCLEHLAHEEIDPVQRRSAVPCGVPTVGRSRACPL